MRLTLLIPELLWSEPGDTEAHAPATVSPLAKILARRHFAQQTNAGWEASLLRLAGLHPDSSLAILRAQGEGIAVAGAAGWLCADPVHLRFHQDRLILADAAELALSEDDLAGLASRINTALSGRAEVRFSSPTRGYLRLATPIGPQAEAGQPLSRKIGCEVRPGDFGGDATLRSLANEIQMLLFADPLNRAREAAGLAAVNALWLWGGGETPRRQTGGAGSSDAAGIDAIAGQHPLVAGIAATLNIPQTTDHRGHTLHFIDTLSTPTHYQDSSAYAAAWQTLDRTHLAPALDALRRFRLDRLDLVAPVVFGELHWQLAPLPAWTSTLTGAGANRWPELVSRLATRT